MKEKITLTDLFNAHLGENFRVGDSLVDIRKNAECLANFCKSEVEKNGVFAKVLADVMAERFAELATMAEKAVTELVNNQLAQDEAEQEKALNNIG